MSPLRATGFCLLALAFLCGCEKKKIYPATENAWKVTDPASFAELEKKKFRPEAGESATSAINAPPGIIAPELYELTERIRESIQGKDNGTTPESYTLDIPAIPGAKLKMIYVPGGSFRMGSPSSEPERNKDEGPVREITLSPYWISEIEIPWEIYQNFMDNGRPRSKDGRPLEPNPLDDLQDDVSQPTAPYTAMNLGMGNGYEKGFPAIAMSHYAASKFCEWLSAQTGQYFRLPTEAEWEYACRAGTDTAYSFGNTSDKAEEYAWFYDNAMDQYQRTGTKKQNPWGIKDMHGNVAEWTLDSYAPYPAAQENQSTSDPVVLIPGAPHVVRGGSWDDDPQNMRSAARRASTPAWNTQDPQNPKSIWYLTNGGTIGFRIVRPATLPAAENMHRYWNSSKGEP